MIEWLRDECLVSECVSEWQCVNVWWMRSAWRLHGEFVLNIWMDSKCVGKRCEYGYVVSACWVGDCLLNTCKGATWLYWVHGCGIHWSGECCVDTWWVRWTGGECVVGSRCGEEGGYGDRVANVRSLSDCVMILWWACGACVGACQCVSVW